MLFRKLPFLCALLMMGTSNIYSQVEIELEEFADGFNLPVAIAHHNTTDLYVVEKTGVIRIIEDDGTVVTEPFLDIRGRVNSNGGEEGLLGLAFHPDYVNNGEFYVNYTNNQDFTVVSRFRRDTTNARKGDPDSEDRMLLFEQPFSNHNGGDLAFGPDGYLYISSGDGGSANDPFDNGQNKNSFLGKMLRIDVDTSESYKNPSTNPFVGTIGLDEIWSYGLRNPWRFSFDKETGDMWIGDVGQNEWEEVDFQPANSTGGENYGWRCYEGLHPFLLNDCSGTGPFTDPIWEYNNNRFVTGCSITGGYVYRGTRFPSLYGYYVYADYCSGNFWGLKVTANDTINIDIGGFQNNQFGAFGEDVNGELYASALREGKIYKIVVPCNLEIELTKSDETCPGTEDGTVTLTLSDPGATVEINWSTGEDGMSIDSLVPGWYSVIVESGSCLLEDSIEVLPSSLTESCIVDTTYSEVYCEGDTVLIEACSAPRGYIYEWYVGGTKIDNQIDRTLAVTETGNYSVAFVEGDCDLGTSREIEIIITTTPNAPMITRSMDTLKADVVADMYNWYLDGSFLITTTVNFLEANMNGSYAVEGVNNMDCAGPLSLPFNFILSSVDDDLKDAIQIYPNPFDNLIYMDNTSNQEVEYHLMDAEGRVIRSGKLSSSETLVTDHLNTGVYLLEIVNGEKRYLERVIKK